MNLVFASKVQIRFRESVENLFFFNPLQDRLRDRIVSALERYGKPEIEEQDGSLYLRFKGKDAQTLFAFDNERSDDDPIGIVVFLRALPADVIIIHIAVHPDYADQGLAVALTEKVKEIAARIRGVERIVLGYREELSILVRERN